MTDEELIKHLRLSSYKSPTLAADRIEQLAGDYAGACNEAADCYIKQCAAEAKLAKAFALLKKAHTYITDLEGHEGAEGFSTSTAVAMREYYMEREEFWRKRETE